MSRIELLEGDDKGRSFGGDARVDGLGAHEPRTVEVLYYRTVWDWQTAQGKVEAGDARRDQAIHDPAHSRMLSPIHQLRDVLWAGRNDDTGGSHDATVVQADAAHMAVADLDALHSDIANDTCPGPLRRGAQPVNQRTPSAVYVVDGMPERPLQLLDEQLRTNEVQRRTVDAAAGDGHFGPANLARLCSPGLAVWQRRAPRTVGPAPACLPHSAGRLAETRADPPGWDSTCLPASQRSVSGCRSRTRRRTPPISARPHHRCRGRGRLG